ncbi:Cobalt import ATP-binding protein CbiO [Anaerohalosphaera lusitana]|uniref:Cobalt import ATP-binding protein CbiO n=1 Tax=Anaerohalosphaera lusitana TaxID=1936003 RepID=A0A1U9NKN1_9BACT|nr:energy-coupling factor ABC transporter ATP-binding protein [Anaerohalosphaera lusitana]AQT68493.1 Cobalt import ATP-binding protein CbiO [Anaerohalosphaera lusitana]
MSTGQAIRIENLCHSYDGGTVTLRDVSLSIGEGEKVALIGPNGAGKSTLLLAMTLFLQPKSVEGQILIHGVEACRKNEKDVRKLITPVLQNPDEQLFMPTVLEDVAFGPLNMGLEVDQARQHAMEAIEQVGLSGLEERSPYHLSAGQKRAAAIATVLSMEPRIITMDEPDTSLDPRSRDHLIELLGSLEQTLVIATCNMHFAAKTCERAVLIDDGKVVVDGPTKELLRDEELMTRHGLETVV